MSTAHPERRRGRRPAGADTRAQLLAAAREAFAERGYEGATVRHIAERAGVDPAMVNHWFGGKEALFTAALEIPVDPRQVLDEVLPGDPALLGERVLRRFLAVWDGAGGAALAAVIQSVASHEAAATLMREVFVEVLIGGIVARTAPDRPRLRAALAGSQVIGMGMVRYVLKLEPLASADHETIVAAIAPTLQRYLAEPLEQTPSRNAR